MDYAFSEFAREKEGIPRELLDVVENTTTLPGTKYLEELARFSLRPDLTEDIFIHFEPLFLELVARWPSLSSPDSIAPALASLLPVAPYLTTTISKVLPSEASIRARLSNISQLSSHEATTLLLTIYRLLSFDLAWFSPLVDLHAVQSLFGVQDRAVRFLAINVACLYLHSSDHTKQDLIKSHLGEEAVVGPYEGGTLDYGVLAFAEAQRLLRLKERLEKTRQKIEHPIDHPKRVLNDSDLSSSTTNIFGVLLPRSEGKLNAQWLEKMANDLKANLHKRTECLWIHLRPGRMLAQLLTASVMQSHYCSWELRALARLSS